jgi:ABC-type transport system involved in cytochrome c biogenesis permease subunit
MDETLLSVSLKNTLTILLMVAVGAGIAWGVLWLVKNGRQSDNG